MFEENVGVGAEEIVANQEYVAYTGDSDDVMQVHCTFRGYENHDICRTDALLFLKCLYQSHCPEWRHLNVYISVTALAGGIQIFKSEMFK